METQYDDVIEQIVRSVFSTMLGLDVVRVDESLSRDEESSLAAVQIAGAWMGSVVLELSPETSIAAAARMLQMPLADVTDEDRRDVAAELVNMIGGNLKSLLPGPSFLSLPTILSGRELGLRVHDAAVLDDVVLASEHGTMRVRLYARLAESAGVDS